MYVSLAHENEVGGTWCTKSIFSMLIYRTLFCFWLYIIVGLSPNSVSQLYCSKDNYHQKQQNTLPVIMITEIMHFNRLLYGRCHRHRRLVLVFGDLEM